MGNFKKIFTKCAAVAAAAIMMISGSALQVTAAGESGSQETQIEFSKDCIVDEIGWIEDKDKLLEGLEQFYHTTGCQPYVMLSEETPESKKEAKMDFKINDGRI